jgi:hypothetical protein
VGIIGNATFLQTNDLEEVLDTVESLFFAHVRMYLGQLNRLLTHSLEWVQTVHGTLWNE